MNKEFTVIENTIEIGIKKPFKFLHMTDTHITRDDPTGWREGAVDLYPGSCEIFQDRRLSTLKRRDIPFCIRATLLTSFPRGILSILTKSGARLITYTLQEIMTFAIFSARRSRTISISGI